jgi:hypothetical protein
MISCIASHLRELEYATIADLWLHVGTGIVSEVGNAVNVG